jgi:xylan 1,4-beta-xylosidase
MLALRRVPVFLLALSKHESVTLNTITNPILPGFHADPSIVRVGDQFYIAVSTFEWFPGVLIYLSRDLVHWRLAARPLNRLSLLDMRGEEGSCGLWAPCLSHDGEWFHLVYSDVKAKTGPYWDVHNYLTRARSVDGPWTERVYLNRSGFDPSLFHDSDGRKWLTNLIQDPRPGRNRSAGIVLQEYDADAGTLTGEPQVIFKGTRLGCTEAPHLYQRNGYYYLMTAEGGTGWEHAVTMARAKRIEGPYEVDPENPLLTAWKKEGSPLHKAGHASLVDTPNGEWYIAHLCSRPVGAHRRCILGRETALQKAAWTHDGWLRLAGGGNTPRLEVPAPDLPAHPWPAHPEVSTFDQSHLPAQFQTLREPADPSWCTLSERPGWLRLYGRLSLFSNYEQSLVGRRVRHFQCEAETLLDFEPRHHLQTAGLAAFYDDQNWFYLAVSHDEERGRVLRLMVNNDHKLSEPLGAVPVPAGPLSLRARMDAPVLRFSWATGGQGGWNDLDLELDASLLSDDVGARFRFTGAFFVICAQDHMNFRTPADFQYFRYRA